jgi:anti-sigma factor RsiW
MEIKIDISNYEEYLLSAVDGELSGEEMVALELFLQQHPHIREEMALLESVKLTSDTEIQFDGKNELYHESIQMLDYVDNELHGAEKLAFEEMIRGNVHLSKELNLLQQARLQPDLHLQFENKQTLYRHNRRTIRPIWWWSTAAAVVVGVAIWVLPVLPGKESMQVAMNKVTTDSGVNNGQVAGNQRSGSVEDGNNELATTDRKANQATNNNQAGSLAQTGTDNQTPTSSQTQTANNQSITNGQQPGSLSSTGKQQLASNKPTGHSKPDVSVNGKSGIAANGKQAIAINSVGNNPAVADNSNPGLSKLAQPVATSGEVVKQLQDKMNEQQEQIATAITNPVQKAPVLANATAINTNNKVSEIVTAPAPVQGELVVSVTMNGDSKLLNGVANVARFFSKKKK